MVPTSKDPNHPNPCFIHKDIRINLRSPSFFFFDLANFLPLTADKYILKSL